MTKEIAIYHAKQEARKHGCVLAVVNDVVATNGENDFTGPYNYCPVTHVSMLHISPNAKVEFNVHPNGDCVPTK